MSRGVSLGRQRLADCRIEWDIRVTRPELLQAILSEAQSNIEREILPAMRARSPEANVVTEVIYDVPLLLPETDGVAERLAKRLTGASSASTVHTALTLAFSSARAYRRSSAVLATSCRRTRPTNGSPFRRSRPAWPISTGSRTV